MLNNILLVASGGALGCVARYVLFLYFAKPWFGSKIIANLPLYINYILVVNVIGSLLIGVFTGLLYNSAHPLQGFHNFVKLFVVVGFLGGLTTFSSFSIDVLTLVEKGKIADAGIFIIISVLFSLIAVYAGYIIAK